MKHLLACLLYVTILLGLNACSKDETNGGVLVKFVNKTGAQISNATANKIQIGNLSNNAETKFIRFEKFGIDTQMPDCDFIGIQNGDTLRSTSVFYWCGTEKSFLTAGEYHIEVKLHTIGAEKYFDLQFK